MSWLPSGDHSSWLHPTSRRPGSAIVLTPWPTDQTVTLDGVCGLARQKVIRCPSGDHCMMLVVTGRGMCARIRPARLITTTASRDACCPGGVSTVTPTASLLPPGLGSGNTRTGVADGQPSAPLSSAAVTRVRSACPGWRSSTALSGGISGAKHSNSDGLAGPVTMAAAETGSPTADVTAPSARLFPPAVGTRSATQDWLAWLARLHVVATTYLPPSANEISSQP